MNLLALVELSCPNSSSAHECVIRRHNIHRADMSTKKRNKIVSSHMSKTQELIVDTIIHVNT